MAKKKTTTEQETTGFMDTPEWEIPQIKGLKDIKAVMFYEYSMDDKNYLIKKGLIEDNHQATKEWMELRTQAITLSAKIESAKTPTKRDKLLEEQDSLYTKTATIPLPLTEMGENTLTTYATLFNFYYQLTGYKGSLGKFLDKHPIIRLPGVISVFYFIGTYIDEIAIPINNNTKALFFNFLKDGTFTTLSIEQNNGLFFSLIADNQKSITAKIFFSLNEADHLNLWQITDFDERIAFLKSKASTKQEKEAIDKEYKAILAKENPFTLILQDLKDLKNPYTITQTLTTTEYAGAKAITGKVENAIMFSKENFVEGTLAGLHYTANITGAKLTKAELFNFAQINNLYLHKDTENMDITPSTPLLIPFKEIQIAKRGEIPDSKAIKIDREAKKFKEQLRNIVTKRVEFKIDYTYKDGKNPSKKQIGLFNRYQTLTEEDYLLQARFDINPETKERYLAITNKCLLLEICKQSNWVITIPHHFYNSELTTALGKTNLSEDTQATAYFLFMQLVSLIDDNVKRILTNKGKSNKVAREIINNTEIPPIKIKYETLYSYGNTKAKEYNTLTKSQKQDFRNDIYNTLEAFGKIIKDHPDDLKKHPFLTLLAEEEETGKNAEPKLYYREYSDPATNATIGIEFTINEAYKENFTTKMHDNGFLTTPPKAIKKKAKQ